MPPYCPREFSWLGIRSSLPIRRAEPVPRMATQLPSLSLGSNRQSVIKPHQRASTFSRRLRPISVGGAFKPITASATISPITGPCLKPWPEPPPTIQTFSASGWRSKMKLWSVEFHTRKPGSQAAGSRPSLEGAAQIGARRRQSLLRESRAPVVG